ncbi:MAG: hypothetical protein QOD47_1377, partial [Gemmatimonadaceae bacterium]|nr:hypothetical protein [Gemmatimonadaceae bacterium]
IVEGEGNNLSIALDLSERATEDRTIPVKRAVRGSADYRNSKCSKRDHSYVFRRSTAV